MSAPVRIQLRRTKGFRLQEASRAANGLAVAKVDRSTPFGNPFDWQTIRSEWGGTPDEARAEAVDLFGRALAGDVKDIEFDEPEEAGPWWRDFRGQVPQLRGLNLACWCRLCEAHKAGKPFDVECKDCAPCHADALGKAANR